MSFIDRRNKFQILQERANLYNSLQDQICDQPESDQIRQIQDTLDEYTASQLQRKDQYNPNSSLSASMPRPVVSVLTTSGLISLGLDQYQTMTTNGQDFNKAIDNQFSHTKRNGVSEQKIKAQYKEREENRIRQQILFKSDHIKEFTDASHQGFKSQIPEYRSEYRVTKDTKEFIRTLDKRNNLQKNDLNVFFNDYLKHKSTLRK